MWLAPNVPDEPDPPRKNYGFKDRDFTRDNPVGPAATPQPTAKELAMMSGPVVRSKTGGTAKADDPNDVYTALQQNRSVERNHGLDAMEIRKIKSRRMRDYWFLMIFGNLVIVGGVALSGFNVISALFGFGGIILFSISVTWIMWQVMNKY